MFDSSSSSARFSSLSHGKKFQKKQRHWKGTEGFAPTDHEKNRNPFQQTGRNDLTHASTTYTNATNKLLERTNNVLKQSQSQTSDEDNLSTLKSEYNNTLQEYNSLVQSAQQQQSSYLTRVNPNNPYLNTFIIFNTGHLAYVTDQGIVKYIGSEEILASIQRNGCGHDGIVDISIPWIPSYTKPGVEIPTNPPLITGTFMKLNQGCGNEGKSVFVRDILSSKDKKEVYKGCYNSREIITEIKFSPFLSDGKNSSNGNSVNASSTLLENNTYGPWCAFDNNIDTWWHTIHPIYVPGTGEYKGDNGVSFFSSSSKESNFIRGEFIQLNLDPNASPSNISRYELLGRPGYPQRSPRSWYLLGNVDGNWVEIDKQSNVKLNENALTSFSISASNTSSSFYSFLLLVTEVGNSGSTNMDDAVSLQIATWNLYTLVSNANSGGAATITDALQPASSTSSFYSTFNDCKNYAIQNGFSLFGFQNAQSDGKGKCMVGQDIAQAQMFGEAYRYNIFNLWSTYQNDGKMATLNNFGSLQLKNETNAAIFSTPANNTLMGNYLGCYNDSGTRVLPEDLSNGQWNSDYSSCMAAAKEKGYTYFGLQSYQTNVAASQCFAGNDKSLAISLGQATNCATLESTTETGQRITVGGGYSNALYSVNPDNGATFFLLLEDDGEMYIYLGSSPSDKQALIWQANTAGKQGDPNPSYSAKKSKFGRNYMVSGESLFINEFIGSNDGSIVLMMTNSGDLQLNAFKKESGCLRQPKDSTYMGTSSDANAVYQMETPGILANLGLLGFIDADSMLYPYATNQSNYSNEYEKMENVTTEGNDIPGASFSGGNLAQCYAQCNENPECGGFVFYKDPNNKNNNDNNDTNVCYPKTAAVLGAMTQQDGSSTLYRRNKVPTSIPIGANKDIANIDSLEYQNYEKSSDPPPSTYGIRNVISGPTQQQLSQLEDKLNLLSSKINSYTTTFSNTNQLIQDQTTTNKQALDDFLASQGKTTEEIETETKNLVGITTIERNLNLVTLQNNYRYMFWSLIAGGLVLTLLNFHTKSP
jgi:hypothetical protein